jgi:NTE family protein
LAFDFSLIFSMHKIIQALVNFFLCMILVVHSSHAVDRPKIGLVLAGGGAAGVAHVGVIRELERMGIRPDCVVGTSMGAIIAGLYAAGYSAAELENVVLQIDWTTILNDYSDRSTQHPIRRDSRTDPFSVISNLPIGHDDEGIRVVGGLVDGVKLSLLLRELTARVSGKSNFDQLPIPFRAIATDLETGEQVIMRSGDLALAMRASMSIPALFPPVERYGRILVDGGVVNNFPTDVARDLCADIIIGVNLPSDPPSRRGLQTVPGAISQLINLMINRQALANEASLTTDDILILPEVNSIGMLDFEKAPIAADIGARAVLAVQDRLLELKNLVVRPNTASTQTGELAQSPSKTATPNNAIQFDTFRVENETRISNDIILSRLALTEPGEVLPEVLQRQLLKLYGLDLFGSINYRLEEQDGKTELVIEAHKRSTGYSEYLLGLGLQDNFNGDGDYTLGFGASFTQLNALAGRINLNAAIGSILGASIEYEQPVNLEQTKFIVSSLRYRGVTVPAYTPSSDIRVGDFRVSEGLASLNYLWIPIESLTLGVGSSYRWNRVERRTGALNLLSQAGLDENWEGGARVGFLFDYDTLDSANLPHSGSQLSIHLNMDIENREENVGEVSIDGLSVATVGRYSIAGFLSIDGEVSPDGLDPHFLGGFQRLSGFSENQLFGNIAMVTGVRAYRNTRSNFLFGPDSFIGASLEYGGVWNDWSDIDNDEALFHGSIFTGAETPLGPVMLGVGFGQNNEWAARFSLGSRF